MGQLRSVLTILVVAHHAFIAYGVHQRFDATHYLDGAPLVDARRWLGFDVMVLFNDTFFMALMFFVSGLFVLPSRKRKGAWPFLRDRLSRLGVPFALAVLFVMPVAYYPSYLATGAQVSFKTFWWQTLQQGPWPGGPAWFLWVLFVFDVTAVLFYPLVARLGDELREFDTCAKTKPWAALAWLLVAASAVYLPCMLAFGPWHWFSLGPFAVQASRALYYWLYFACGFALGPTSLRTGLLCKDGVLAARWQCWSAGALASFALVVLFSLARLHAWLHLSEDAWNVLHGLLFVLSGALQSFAALSLSLRFAGRPRPLLGAFAPHAYTVYVVHYPFVIWLQRWMLGIELPAAVKGVVVLLCALGGSFLTSAVLHTLRGVRGHSVAREGLR